MLVSKEIHVFMHGGSLIMIGLDLNKTNIHSLCHRLDSRSLIGVPFDLDMTKSLSHDSFYCHSSGSTVSTRRTKSWL